MRNDRVWPCSCGDHHFLRVTFYDDDPEGWITLVDDTRGGLWQRIRWALKLVRTGRAPHFGVEVVLEPDNVAEILEVMQQAADKIGTPA